MSTRPWGRAPTVLAVAAVLALALGAGCKKEEEPVPNPKTEGGRGGGPPKASSPGEALFAQKGCVRCHSIGSQSGGPKGKRMGPDLSTVGADPAHTPEWFAEFIRNPHGKNPESKMPPHDESKISEQEMTTLVTFLSGLK